MSVARHHADWLNLVEVSGPFLAVSVLSDVFPQELDAHDPHLYSRLKLAYDEWVEGRRDQEVHHAWIDFVLRETLELDDVLLRGQELPAGLEAKIDLHNEVLRPDAVVQRNNGKQGKPKLLIAEYPSGQRLSGTVSGKRWSASPATRMMELLHRTENSLGLVTNGEEWTVVHAKAGETTGFGSWYSEILTDERIALRSFRSLLSKERFFGVPDGETLEGLLERSREDQKEVTDQLGRQVRRAVETLISSLDWVDRGQNRQLLAGYDEKRLYESALTIMMRLVFLLCAEERGLLLLGKNELYDQHYAVSPLRDQLRTHADQYGEEILQSRYDAWSRLLATFRAVHAGVAHEDLQLPAYGGSLFDPDRFPFLEGRAAGTCWKDEPASPLPIDNRTVLELLESLQMLEVKVGRSKGYETQRLSFRALDIEQIGHVYEGLLDHTAVRATDPVLGLAGAGGLEPEVLLYDLEVARQRGDDELLRYLKATTKKQTTSLEKSLGLYDTIEAPKLSLACDSDAKLVDRVRPYVGLVRENSRGVPVVFTPGSIYVTQGSDRRATGTHYTPRSLTEEICQHALDPLVYRGMADGVTPSSETLKSPREILSLKICDMAMGSGAFLVQACRYLAEKLVEAWGNNERQAEDLLSVPFGEPSQRSGEDEYLPKERDERLAVARRLVVERCLYGVDRNPLAVEMAKLSLWLITLDEKKPFTFLDHAFRTGDSLLGVTDRDQLQYFNLKPNKQAPPIFGDQLLGKLQEAQVLRDELESFTINSPRDGERKRELLERAERLTEVLKNTGDLLVGLYLNYGGKPSEKQLAELAPLVQNALVGEKGELVQEAEQRLARGKPDGAPQRQPFQWALEFPEVFCGDNPGFDTMIGNPPFRGGQRITGMLGTDYRDLLVEHVACGQRGSADLCVYFLLRACSLLCAGGTLGYVTTNTISEGDTREVGLDQICSSKFQIYRANASCKWPGEANLEVAHLWVCSGLWKAKYSLDDEVVFGITAFLTSPGRVAGNPYRLAANSQKSFQGSIILGLGFTLTPEAAEILVAKDQRNRDILFPYINGNDLNSSPSQNPSRWVINFGDWPLEKAQQYPECLKIVRELVKPERDKNKYSPRARENWWLYERARPELYCAIANMKQVFCQGFVSKYLQLAPVSTSWVYAAPMIVFVDDRFCFLGLVQSTIHEVWTLKNSSSLETRLRYAPSDCFETFPFPDELTCLELIGERYNSHRYQIMQCRSEGLTKTYNRFHDPTDSSQDISKLRRLHQEMDERVAAAYGWADLALGHDFHETKQGLRYTISESARQEVLDRLLALNHERYAEEVTQGLHDKKKAKKQKTKMKTKPFKKDSESIGQGELF